MISPYITAFARRSAKLGLTNWLKPADTGHWEMNPETGIVRRTETPVSTELKTCAACHSRRKMITESPLTGAPYLDGYLPPLLEAGLYHADANGFQLEGGERVPAALKVWAAGIRASGSFDDSGLELNRVGQVVVGPNLLAKGEQHIFALGDCASLVPGGRGAIATLNGPGCQPAGHASDPPSAKLAAQGQTGAAIQVPRFRRAGRAQRLQCLRDAGPVRLLQG
jgi:Pyridine nucleotide-disulphide oxidoreductase